MQSIKRQYMRSISPHSGPVNIDWDKVKEWLDREHRAKNAKDNAQENHKKFRQEQGFDAPTEITEKDSIDIGKAIWK